MTLKNEVDQLFNSQVESGNIREILQPVGAVIAAVSDGVVAANAWSPYVEIVAAAVIPDPCWLTCIYLSTPVVETFDSDVAIAFGGAGSEEDLAIFHAANDKFVIVEGLTLQLLLAYPIKIAGEPRLAVRIRKSTAASAAGWSLKVGLAENIGS